MPTEATPTDPGAFRVGRSLDGQMSWWVRWEVPNYNPPGVRKSTQEEADIMARFEWKMDRPGDAERLMELING